MSERSSGILLPVYALPSPHGGGTMGRAAFEFIDFLAAAHQRWWQILPIGPTGYGDSPYQSFSTFAGNPYFIDLDLLEADGLLTAAEIAAAEAPDLARVDYGALYRTRPPLLRRAAERLLAREPGAAEDFAAAQPWVRDWALFSALKSHFGGAAWTAWEEDIRLRQPEALARYRALLARETALETAVQLLFDRQWTALRAYAAEKGVKILGDLPFYVAPDSADVWAEPRFFALDAHGRSTAVAGVPPDYFSADGQLWGNPLYDWDAMAADGYGWWIRRIAGAQRRFDAVRIDHFRGFARYWAVPAGAESAREGAWLPGPGMALLGVLNGWFPDLKFIAEDLGVLTPEVPELREECGWPGMRVLQFAFDPDGDGAYLPHSYERNCLCCTGTHDNTTLAAWVGEVSDRERAFAQRYLGVPAHRLREALLRAGLGSVADYFFAQMQDYLALGAPARTNTPGTAQGNWQWRLAPGQLTAAKAAEIAALTALYRRSAPAEKEETK